MPMMKSRTTTPDRRWVFRDDWAYPYVSQQPHLTASEFSALQEIGKGPIHASIPNSAAARLLELKLAYRLLGDIRITAEGRKRLLAGPQPQDTLTLSFVK